MGTANPMMGRLPNGRSAGVPSWGNSSNTTTLNYSSNQLQRPDAFLNDARTDTHQPNQRTTQSFREDDFPALGSGVSEVSNTGSGSYAALANGSVGRSGPAPDNSSFDDFPSLPGMLSNEIKGMSSINQQATGLSQQAFMQMPLSSGSAGSSSQGTSTLTNANLQQHRTSLLGAMTQGRSTPNPQQLPATTNQRDGSQHAQTRNSNPQDPRFGRAINAPPNLSLMNGPPALGGSAADSPQSALHLHTDEPPTPRSATVHLHTRDRGGDLSVPVPSHAPGLSAQAVQLSQELSLKSKEAPPSIEDETPLTETEQYCIKGLLPIIIRQSSADVCMLALGSDLTNLGLKLAADDDRLHSSLWSPWSDTPNLTTLPDSNWSVPSCYTNDMLGVLPPPHLKIGNFAEETLFYIFYTQPRDKLQEHAAAELTARNWRFHKSLGLWLTKEPGVEPQLRTTSMERGTYVFWDSGRWERIKKVFELYYEDLEDRFSNVAGAATGSLSQQQQQIGAQIGPQEQRL